MSSSLQFVMAPDAPTVPTKRRRITRACDRCHRACLKCAPGPTPQTCRPCASHWLECTFDRPVKRRGPAARSRAPPTLHQQQSPTSGIIRSTSTTWQYTHIANEAVIEYLVDYYSRIVYPILLYFHWPSFSSDVRAKRYTFDRSFFALTMAVCATASTRLPEGLPAHLKQMQEDGGKQEPTSGVFYTACLGALPSLITDEVEFNFMRTEALLGMLCLEYNNPRGCHAHLHRYLAMCAETGFNNEQHWHPDLNEIEIQERRRLFWQQYHFDVYLATVFGSSVRQHSQTQCNVLYPAEVYDDCDITETGVVVRDGEHVSFIRGWNFVTDLYRILEHFTEQARTPPLGKHPSCDPVTQLLSGSTPNLLLERTSTSEVLATVQQMYHALPVELKQARPTTGDTCRDRFGFQAVNVIITLTTLKMVLARFEDHSASRLCTMAGGFIDELSAIPTAYMQSTSTAMVHHLAGVGHILGRAITAPLSQWTYLQVRSALLALADLISSLEKAIKSTMRIESRLREHVERIDEYMSEAAKQSRQNQIIHSAMPKIAGQHENSQEGYLEHGAPGVDTQQLGVATTPLETDLAQGPLYSAEPQVNSTYIDLSNMYFDPDCQLQLPDELFRDWLPTSEQGDYFPFFFGQDLHQS